MAATGRHTINMKSWGTNLGVWPKVLIVASFSIFLVFGLAKSVSTAPYIGGFDTRIHSIPLEGIKSGGPPKDGIPALTEPTFLDGEAARFLKPTDLVIGVSMNGSHRAYPLKILDRHENVNDTIGRTPIAVSYCPLCKSSLVFDRRVGGSTREFGISGLLYNSNVLIYDRQSNPRQESLWSQVEMRAVTGPAAEQGLTLTLLPSEMTDWGSWRQRYPHTQVLSNLTGHGRDYDRSVYQDYFKNRPPHVSSFVKENKTKTL